MRMLLPIAVLSLAACAGEPLPATTTSEIINGTDDEGHPAVAFLANEIVAGCSGTLISSKIVLTAAHCVVDGTRVRLLDSVVFGATSSSTERRQGSGVVWHPDFVDDYPWPNDIAIVILKTRASVEPMPIHRSPPAASGDVTFVGFGLQKSPDGRFGEKQKVTVPITGVEDQWIITGPSFCQGDSGGPGLLTVDGKEYVAGVVSFGESGCQGENASQRVDLHAAWLDQLIALHDPPSCERDFRCITGCPSGDADCPCSPTDGVCMALCTDPESDPDCPRGCGPGDSCVRGPTCPAPDPDCGDPCGDEGHCLESCAARDPDCPAPKPTGAACTRNFECAVDAICHSSVCTETCDPAQTACGAGGTCTRLTPQIAICMGEGGGDGGGCSVGAPGGGGGGAWSLLLGLAALSLVSRPRPRSRRASSRR